MPPINVINGNVLTHYLDLSNDKRILELKSFPNGNVALTAHLDQGSPVGVLLEGNSFVDFADPIRFSRDNPVKIRTRMLIRNNPNTPRFELKYEINPRSGMYELDWIGIDDNRIGFQGDGHFFQFNLEYVTKYGKDYFEITY